MEQLPKNAKTLEEIEEELMFGRLPEDDDEENLSRFGDEFDAANEETFGAELDDITDAELENYAAQTARLRLDDPVWETPSSSFAKAPDASQVPLPFSIFDNGNLSQREIGENSLMGDSIWTPNKNSLGLWSEETIGGINPSLPDKELTLGDLSALLGDDNIEFNANEPSNSTCTSHIGTSKSENCTINSIEQDLSRLSLGVNSTQIVDRIPSLPAEAISIEELEKDLMKNASISPSVQNFMDAVVKHPNPSIVPLENTFPIQPNISIPPLPPGLQIPPIPSNFFPFVPIWLSSIVERIPLPMGVPPIPPFLFHLLNTFRDPILVRNLILQSVIPQPPQQLPPPPSMTPNSQRTRKPAGMPSFRTIEDLAFDGFAGYMSYKEREWLIKMQLSHIQGSGDIMTEDYYYQKWRENKIKNGWVPTSSENKNQDDDISNLDYEDRIRRMNYREKQKERANKRRLLRQMDKEQREKERDTEINQGTAEVIPANLGVVSKSSSANPRKLIDMNNIEDFGGAVDEQRKIVIAKKLRTLLLRIESALDMLIEVDEIQSNPNNPAYKDLSKEEKEKEVKKRINLITAELMGDDLHKLLQMTKGRKVITKVLNKSITREQAKIIVALISASSLVNKKIYDEITTDVLPTVYSILKTFSKEQFSVLVQALNIDILKKQLFDSNKFIRDFMLTIIYVGVINNQPFLDWAKHTKFPSLYMNGRSLDTWRKALISLRDEDLRWFSDHISDSGIREAQELSQLIDKSI